MKLVIYAICKNEASLADRFAKSIDGKADKVIICDTGSTDGTQDILRSYGFEVHDIVVTPWRFDIARNISLSKIPPGYDIAVCPDLDDVFVPGWRDIIEKDWEPGKTKLLRYPYPYAWDDKTGEPRTTIRGFKIHDPYLLKWYHPIHEFLEFKDLSIASSDQVKITMDVIFEHRPLFREDRFNRLKIFEEALKGEFKDNVRMVYLYARDLFINELPEKAIPVFLRYLDMTKAYQGEEHPRSLSCRYIAFCLAALNQDASEMILWLMRSTTEWATHKDPWLYLAHAWLYYDKGLQAYAMVKIAEGIPSNLQLLEFDEFYWTNDKIKDMTIKAKELMMVQENENHYTNDIEGWMSEVELDALYREAGKHSSIVEVGSWKGKSTHALLSGNPKATVYAIDHFKGSLSDGDAHKEAFEDSDAVYNQFLGNVGHFSNLQVLKMGNEEAVNQFQDNSIDMVFLDGDHSYEAVKGDIERWLPKTKILLCGHDYNFPGVTKAVKEKFKKINVTGSIWVHKVGDL